jgi:hypothetical protein
MQHEPNPNGASDCEPKDPQEQIIELRYNLWSAENEINYLRGLARQQLGMIISMENSQRLFNHGMAKLQRDQTEPLERQNGEMRIAYGRLRYIIASIFQDHAWLQEKYPHYSHFFSYDPDQHSIPAPVPDQRPDDDRDHPARA